MFVLLLDIILGCHCQFAIVLRGSLHRSNLCILHLHQLVSTCKLRRMVFLFYFNIRSCGDFFFSNSCKGFVLIVVCSPKFH